MGSDKKFRRCWACDSLCREEILNYKRIEHHHVWGKDKSEFTVPLCLICHDLIDRTKICDSFEEYLKAIPQINELLSSCEDDGKYKNLKLMVLKFLKLSLWYSEQHKQAVKDKQNHNTNKGETN